VATSIGLISLGGIAFSGISVQIAVQRMYAGMTGFALLALPFFILSGTLMEVGGISKRLINFITALIGHKTGGLTAVVVVTSMIFASLSGSGPATTAALGAILIPTMRGRNYAKGYAVGIQATAGQLGIIIPPSIPMVLYGVATETSIGGLFLGGILPGIFIGLTLIVVSYIMCKRRSYIELGNKCSFNKIWIAFKEAVWAIMMPIIILGGIYGGIFTPTEAAVVSVVYAIIVGLFVYRELDWKKFKKALLDATITNAMLMFIVANAAIFSWILTRNQIPQILARTFASISPNGVVFLILTNILLLIVGCFFDASPAMLIIAPILLPIAKTFGINPVHFGVMMTVNMALGQVTPPVGVNLFVGCRIGNTSIEEVMKNSWPYLVILFIDLMIITYVPGLTLFLPRLMGLA
jgi:C4-dicarboxylate transporter DctM subunit